MSAGARGPSDASTEIVFKDKILLFLKGLGQVFTLWGYSRLGAVKFYFQDFN